MQLPSPMALPPISKRVSEPLSGSIPPVRAPRRQSQALALEIECCQRVRTQLLDQDLAELDHEGAGEYRSREFLRCLAVDTMFREWLTRIASAIAFGPLGVYFIFIWLLS